MNEKQKAIGALWVKQGKNGSNYFYGSIEIDGEKHQFVAFENKYKRESKHPDYSIFPQKPSSDKNPPKFTTGIKEFRPKSECSDMPDDEIPF